VVVGAIDGRQATPATSGHERAVREEVEFFSGPDLVFGCRHIPLGGAVAGVVVCSPLPYQTGAAYLPDARLGRQLSRAGVVVQRFHYRGTGHSDGDPAGLTLDAMARDARDALAHLRHRCGVQQVGVVGTAAGAAVAALVARDLPGAPVALWEPFEPAAPDHSLTDLVGTGPRPLLMAAAGLGAGSEVGAASGLADDVAAWRSLAFDVQIVPPVGAPGGPGLVETTAAWFVRHLPAREQG
jgi:alpha/beta superfamily hydrolase